jgi:chemotaxis protein CheD
MTVAAPPLARPHASGIVGEGKNFYFDRDFSRYAVKILPGEFFVADNDIVVTTVLGSCVSACIWDRTQGIGGMNHFMLPDGADREPGGLAGRYGVFAMEQLINELLKRGARKANFEAKVFGGGNVMANIVSIDVGKRNGSFVLEFLATEGIRVSARDLLDKHPRRVAFFPATGRALCKKLPQADTALVAAERQYGAALASKPVAGEVELF